MWGVKVQGVVVARGERRTLLGWRQRRGQTRAEMTDLIALLSPNGRRNEDRRRVHYRQMREQKERKTIYIGRS